MSENGSNSLERKQAELTETSDNQNQKSSLVFFLAVIYLRLGFEF